MSSVFTSANRWRTFSTNTLAHWQNSFDKNISAESQRELS